MTCREKLALEHPNEINSCYSGGCFGCPFDYGYLAKEHCRCRDVNSCTECWDREIPGTKKAEKGEKNFVVYLKDGTIRDFDKRCNRVDEFSKNGAMIVCKHVNKDGSFEALAIIPISTILYILNE